MWKSILFLCMFTLAVAGFSCKQKAAVQDAQTPVEVSTPVTITTLKVEPIVEYVDLNATSSFLQNNYVKASATAYIQSVHVQFGQFVPQGKELFTLRTKESQSIGNAINVLDSSFHFSGIINIRASQHGYVTQLDHQPGDYVQDGEQLAVISDMNSFAFILNLPYELRPYVLTSRGVEVILPDGVILQGHVASSMPTVDSASQTQQVIIKVNSKHPIPEKLIAKVHIVKKEKAAAASLPKQAVLTDETQTSFWVMKLIDSVTAVKIDIIKGMETADRVEIVRPVFSATDRFVLTGNYGLPDTAKVKIVKQ